MRCQKQCSQFDSSSTWCCQVQRKQQKDARPKRRHAGDHIIRRASSLRHSQRSVGRSGYAFSHQEGFAELITSGSMMPSTSTSPWSAASGSVVKRSAVAPAPTSVENVKAVVRPDHDSPSTSAEMSYHHADEALQRNVSDTSNSVRTPVQV